jgi:iron complex transport system substrate-binding protein
VLGSFSQPDLAAIDSIHPVLVLTSTAFQRDLASRLRAKGYRVLHYEPASLEDIFASIDELGTAIGRGNEAAKSTADMRRELAEVAKRSSALPRVKVYLEINHMGPWTSGSKSPLNESIRAAGGENIFGDQAQDAFTVNNEEVVRRNPDVILSPIWLDAKVGGNDGITTLLEIMSRPGYDNRGSQ